jgi:hypothetical protein
VDVGRNAWTLFKWTNIAGQLSPWKWRYCRVPLTTPVYQGDDMVWGMPNYGEWPNDIVAEGSTCSWPQWDPGCCDCNLPPGLGPRLWCKIKDIPDRFGLSGGCACFNGIYEFLPIDGDERLGWKCSLGGVCGLPGDADMILGCIGGQNWLLNVHLIHGYFSVGYQAEMANSKPCPGFHLFGTIDNLRNAMTSVCPGALSFEFQNKPFTSPGNLTLDGGGYLLQEDAVSHLQLEVV